MIDMINLIEEIEKSIFDFDIKLAMNKVAKLIEDLIGVSSKLNQPKLRELMGIMNTMNSALSNKDYLLFNDILEFELKSFIETNII